MAQELIVNYIREQLAAGVQKEVITAALTAQRWAEVDINDSFASVEKPVASTPSSAPVTVVPAAKPADPVTSTPTQVQTPPSVTMLDSKLWLWVGIGAGVLALIGVGSYLWMTTQTFPAVSIEAPIEEPVEPEVLSMQYTFTPQTSNIPQFTLMYPASLETPQAAEREITLTLTFPSIESILTVSAFPSPLDEGQEPETYFTENFPTATVSFTNANGHTIAAVSRPDFASDQIVYYVFLDDTAITIDARGTVDARIIESIQL